MAQYVDGFVIPIPKKNVGKYRKMAQMGCRLWMKHGALSYYECVGNDLHNQCGLTFPKLCKLKKTDTVVFAFIVYRNKAHRNRVNKKVMSDPAMQGMGEMKMPFDMKTFAFGGFNVLVKR